VGVCMCGFGGVWLCEYVWVCVCVGFVMFRSVYLWVL